ncbi:MULTISPECIES: sensor histidine kinase [unclassified Paenibacillus]|uniref:sensor histidine kinase n=1 Tax=unclassified Paenibacillus TaxID=185978 RepID=UPI0030F81EE6
MLTNYVEYRLDEQIRQSLLLLESVWTTKGLFLNIDLQELIYYGNEELMSQVWLNVIGNAIKFTPKGGEITVALRRNGQTISVVICDTGIGMSPETLKHIFEKFYQGDPTRSADGNGLGLALVSRIIKLSGGTIDVSSTPGQGSKFSFILPMPVDSELDTMI